MQVQGQRKAVEQRAYELWECAGRPEGRALEHWLQAESECAGAKTVRSKAKRAANAAPGAAPRAPRTAKVTPIKQGKTPTARRK
jgi:hypothetical protein